MSTKEKSSFELVASVGLKKYHFTFSLSSSSFQRLPEIFTFDTFYECQCLEQNCSIEAQVTLDNEDDSDGKEFMLQSRKRRINSLNICYLNNDNNNDVNCEIMEFTLRTRDKIGLPGELSYRSTCLIFWDVNFYRRQEWVGDIYERCHDAAQFSSAVR